MSPYDKEELEATKDEADVNAQNKSDDEMAPPNAVSKEQGSVTGGFKLLLLALMVVQNSSTVLVGRYTRSSVPKDDLFNVNHLVLIAELAKFFLSAALEFNATSGGLFHSIKENILDRPLDALKISVPALLYLVQNTLLYVALSNLAAPIFQVTYQAKLVTTAVVSAIMLQRKYSLKQWVCLVILSVGVAIVVLGEKQDKKKEDDDDKTVQSLGVGLIAVSIACFSSALAGVYFEKVLKNKVTTDNGVSREPVSLWMRNMQLAFFSVIIAFIQGLAQQGEEPKKPYLHGFTCWVWVLVSLQVGGGLLVAAVIKYADNVLKGLATGVSVVVATCCSAVFFGVPLTSQFSAGAGMILTSVYFFSNDLPKCCLASGKKNAEMNPMLPK